MSHVYVMKGTGWVLYISANKESVRDLNKFTGAATNNHFHSHISLLIN